MPSMLEAGCIRDVVERHAYVFRNGLSDAGFFDLARRRHSEEFSLISSHIGEDDSVLEIGCFTGLNLLLLAERGISSYGVEFVEEAVQWLTSKASELHAPIACLVGVFPEVGTSRQFSRIICADVLEHQLNVGRFLAGVVESLTPAGKALFVVPKGREYFDCGHAAFWPDAECLANTLSYFFDAIDIRDICDGRKMFACCQVTNA